jgi:hypothetical protein
MKEKSTLHPPSLISSKLMKRRGIDCKLSMELLQLVKSNFFNLKFSGNSRFLDNKKPQTCPILVIELVKSICSISVCLNSKLARVSGSISLFLNSKFCILLIFRVKSYIIGS